MGLDKYYDFTTNLDDIKIVHKLISDSISEDAPFTLKEGGVIKSGYCSFARRSGNFA